MKSDPGCKVDLPQSSLIDLVSHFHLCVAKRILLPVSKKVSLVHVDRD